MAAITYPNLGLKAGFALGENGWDDEMSANIRLLSILVQGRVLSKGPALPGAPVEGDIVILDQTNVANPNQIAAFTEGAWFFVVPQEGWLFWDQSLDIYQKFTGALWEPLTVGGAVAFSGAHLKRGAAAAQANAANNYVRILYATETLDVGGWFDSAANNGRLVVPAGVSYVQLGATSSRSTDSNGDVQFAIRKNGTDVAFVAVSDTFFGLLQINSPPISVVAGDYFELWIRSSVVQSWDGAMDFWIKKLG